VEGVEGDELHRGLLPARTSEQSGPKNAKCS
jgi:hypothetical protein